jgi:hypothetical protein
MRNAASQNTIQFRHQSVGAAYLQRASLCDAMSLQYPTLQSPAPARKSTANPVVLPSWSASQVPTTTVCFFPSKTHVYIRQRALKGGED